MSLQQTLEDQAFKFAQDIIAALRMASIDELLGLTSGRASTKHTNGAEPAPRVTRLRRGRLARRSADDIGKALEQIEAVLRAHSEGMRAEQIRTELGFDAKEMPRPIKEGLASGRLTKSGQKRATLYMLGSGWGKAKPATKSAAKKKRPKS